MKKATLFAVALVCATLLAVDIASAQPVAGFSPNLADPQPTTSATLTEEANRLIRWQGWLDVDAFTSSVLGQMQKQLGNGIEVGKFTIAEHSIRVAVEAAEKNDRNFKMNRNLEIGQGEVFSEAPKLYVWTYRHNYTDTGLYQLYISVKGKMLIGTGLRPGPGSPPLPVRHKDIQSLNYEFGKDGSTDGRDGEPVPTEIYADVEIWRGAVVRVNASGRIALVGNEAGVETLDGGVSEAPISDWERAPSLEGNPNYNPKNAAGAAYVEPLERGIAIESNNVQKATGSVPKASGDRWQDAQEQGRVNTVPNFRFRSR